MDSNSALRLYPRGFLGSSIKSRVELAPKPYSDQINKHQFMVAVGDNARTSVQPNPIVEGLYSDYIKNSVNTGAPKFRASILSAAIDAFGTKSFLVWYMSQFNSPSAGSLHNDFLTDTLRFINTGSRHMSLETWMSLITITDETDNIGKVPDEVKTFFSVGEFERISAARNNVMVIEVIQKWCSKPGGLEDLLGTLHILFGNP